MNEKNRGSFTGSIGFVLAAAGSAVGLGNLWRFPYLAAKDGGGVFLFVYIILALTFGFALMTTEIALGRKHHHSGSLAYSDADKRFSFLGPVSFVVPLLIFPYYCVIGGWVTRYGLDYLMGYGSLISADSNAYFNNFITSSFQPILWTAVYMGISALVVFYGVEKGIEKFSKVLMPMLCVLIVGIAVFSLTLKDAESGRTAIDGLKIYVIPNFKGMTIGRFFKITLDAMTQMFFSMSLAMGIMVTYGSYSKKDTNLVKSVNQIEIFDTAIALLAGLIMIPAVFTFQGTEGLDSAGPSLLFKSLPNVFNSMGFVGNIIGPLFFLLVLFAALTSSVSIMEAVVSMIMDKFHTTRKKTSIGVVIVSAIIALITCLGYNVLYCEATLKIGNLKIFEGFQILDILDFATNNILMPIVAFLTCILVGWFTRTDYVTDEVKLNGEKFGRESLYKVMVKYVAPVCLVLILLSSFGIFNNL